MRHMYEEHLLRILEESSVCVLVEWGAYDFSRAMWSVTDPNSDSLRQRFRNFRVVPGVLSVPRLDLEGSGLRGGDGLWKLFVSGGELHTFSFDTSIERVMWILKSTPGMGRVRSHVKVFVVVRSRSE